MEYVVKIPMTKVERGHLHVNRNFEEIDFAQQSQSRYKLGRTRYLPKTYVPS